MKGLLQPWVLPWDILIPQASEGDSSSCLHEYSFPAIVPNSRPPKSNTGENKVADNICNDIERHYYRYCCLLVCHKQTPANIVMQELNSVRNMYTMGQIQTQQCSSVFYLMELKLTVCYIQLSSEAIFWSSTYTDWWIGTAGNLKFVKCDKHLLLKCMKLMKCYTTNTSFTVDVAGSMSAFPTRCLWSMLEWVWLYTTFWFSSH